MGAEDFSYFQQRTPGLRMHLGVRPKAQSSMPGAHSARFLPDERALRTAMLVLAGLAIDRLGNTAR
jgi:metal-dependent amidase/aminoacylase/carboxypeptidase family protein